MSLFDINIFIDGVNILIGENGSGKTKKLEEISSCYQNCIIIDNFGNNLFPKNIDGACDVLLKQKRPIFISTHRPEVIDAILSKEENVRIISVPSMSYISCETAKHMRKHRMNII